MSNEPQELIERLQGAVIKAEATVHNVVTGLTAAALVWLEGIRDGLEDDVDSVPDAGFGGVWEEATQTNTQAPVDREPTLEEKLDYIRDKAKGTPFEHAWTEYATVDNAAMDIHAAYSVLLVAPDMWDAYKGHKDPEPPL